MSTTLDTSFLRAIVLMSGFRGNAMKSAQAGLIYLGLQGDFLACDLPRELTNGSKHIAGAACGALVASELIECVGRVKSPDPAAKGRKLDVWRIPAHRISSAKSWLRANGFVVPQTAEQLSLLTA